MLPTIEWPVRWTAEAEEHPGESWQRQSIGVEPRSQRNYKAAAAAGQRQGTAGDAEQALRHHTHITMSANKHKQLKHQKIQH